MQKQHLIDELIQVAAVACATVEDLKYGEAEYYGPAKEANGFYTRGAAVLYLVADERQSQDKKWGPQHHTIAEWLVILMEEVGEAAQAALDDVIFVKEDSDGK